MVISPFTPLFFDNRKTDGIESGYIQTFSTSDRILLQIFDIPGVEPVAFVLERPSGKSVYKIVFGQWCINPNRTLYFAEICLSPGYYNVYINGHGSSDVFRVTDDNIVLSKTTLIQYSMKNNRQRDDTVFFIDGMQYFFDFRVPGGFKDSSWTFGVESEQFVTPFGDISQLYGLATTQKKFTMGGSIGVPVHFGELLNLILTCTHVYFDGVKYTRVDANVPEMTVQLDGLNSFVFTQTLRPSTKLDPIIETKNQAIMRRLSDNIYRSTDLSTNRLIF